ncbi:hypothetical protein CcaverHIS002_0504600 [Cutaneotrichosporon cavernicola]|nr:hypothetical protein CcaverHIS002_0504600 [Cutaneotrichosporon cavernicola]
MATMTYAEPVQTHSAPVSTKSLTNTLHLGTAGVPRHPSRLPFLPRGMVGFERVPRRPRGRGPPPPPLGVLSTHASRALSLMVLVGPRGPCNLGPTTHPN